MRKKCLGLGLLAALIFTLGSGCKKSASDSEVKQKTESRKQKSTTLACVHWLGKDGIAAETNAARFLSLWNLPESARLESQTLDKLAAFLAGEPSLIITNEAPMPGTPQATNPPPVVSLLSTINYPLSTKLRPLLDDLVRDEWYLEIQAGRDASPRRPRVKEDGHFGETSLPGAELALAIRLGDARAGLWTSNLVAVLGSLTNAQALPAQANGHAWRFSVGTRSNASPSSRDAVERVPTLQRGPLRLDLARAGDWTLVGLAGEHNTRLDDLAARIQRAQTPVPVTPSDSASTPQPSTTPPLQSPSPSTWLEADLDLPRLSSALGLGWNLPTNFPRTLLTAQADDAGVRTRAKLDFSEPLPLEMEAWNIPSYLIQDPLSSFAAVRGIRPWLKSFQPWRDLQLGTPPNQAFFWSQNSAPFLHFLAAPSVEASNQVARLSELVLEEVNPILATNGWPDSAFARPPNGPGLVWRGAPFFSPILDYSDSGSNRFLFAGLSPNSITNAPAPAGLFQYLQASPNLVAYDWENTRLCADDWAQMGNLIRRLLCLPQIPPRAGLAWVFALTPQLGNSVTSVELSSPTRLSIARSSSIGFTGVELLLLADWLESLQFPRSLHTFTAPPPPLTDMPSQTQAPASAK